MEKSTVDNGLVTEYTTVLLGYETGKFPSIFTTDMYIILLAALVVEIMKYFIGLYRCKLLTSASSFQMRVIRHKT